ncbi:MAG: anti-sigma factor, partial [Planctomycetota bacterium]
FGGLSAADVAEFERAAAAVACVCAAHEVESLPDEIRLRCAGAGRAVADGQRHVHGPTTRSAPLRFTQHAQQSSRANGRTGSLGWVAAAACLVIAVAAAWPRSAVGPSTPEEQMSRLLATANDLTRWDWASWGPAPSGESYAGVTGEVVWSEDAQEGYLVLEGMPANDPSAEQYQLWVVESSRCVPLEDPPVDGGVFDVADNGRVIVPIRCAIPARDVVAFAVTVEEPGGVVVSDQSRKAVIAAAPTQG